MSENTTLTPVPSGPTDAELEAARDRAAEALSEAYLAISEWSALVREGAAERVGSVLSDAVIHDPAYDHALDVFSPINRAVAAFRDVGGRITAGGLR